LLYAGTSSYSLKEWVGRFYPPKTPARGYLRFFASRIRTVEINYTYRRFPRSTTAAAWAAQTPEDFQFSFKMHQSVTHIARLRGVAGSVHDFLKALDPLGPRLGVILFQLPPSFGLNLERLEEVLEELPKGKRFAFEFRDPSWDHPDVIALLRKRGVALCQAETEIRDEAPPITAPYAYIRIRKEPPYTEEEAARIRRKVTEGLKTAQELFIYIKHDNVGLAPEVAQELQGLG
jgi:uncharacterized protein YecE (DUF72 family)